LAGGWGWGCKFAGLFLASVVIIEGLLKISVSPSNKPVDLMSVNGVVISNRSEEVDGLIHLILLNLLGDNTI
jgi:hypothetical protein